MARAPFQVLVLPYRILDDNSIRYAVFKRTDTTHAVWQGIAGGGEDEETPLQAARREAFEEGAIPDDSRYLRLDSTATIPVDRIAGFLWGDEVMVVPEYCFGVLCDDEDFHLSSEHSEYRWLSYGDAYDLLSRDSNKNALWELNYRLMRLLTED